MLTEPDMTFWNPIFDQRLRSPEKGWWSRFIWGMKVVPPMCTKPVCGYPDWWPPTCCSPACERSACCFMESCPPIPRPRQCPGLPCCASSYPYCIPKSTMAIIERGECPPCVAMCCSCGPQEIVGTQPHHECQEILKNSVFKPPPPKPNCCYPKIK